MKRLATLFLCLFALSLSAQTLLTVPGLAAHKKKLAGGGGGGDITTGLIHHWHFDENTGTTTADAVGGAGYLGTFHGTMGWAPAKYGASSVWFDRTTSGNGITLGTAITPSSTATYAFWFWPSNDVHQYQAMVSKDGNNNIYYLPPAGNTGGGQIDYYVAGVDHLSASSVATNGWHHCAVTYNSGTVHIYLDGVLDANSYSGFSAPINIVGFGAESGNASAVFGGRLDDMCLYSRVLSGTDISTLFSSSTGPTP